MESGIVFSLKKQSNMQISRGVSKFLHGTSLSPLTKEHGGDVPEIVMCRRFESRWQESFFLNQMDAIWLQLSCI